MITRRRFWAFLILFLAGAFAGLYWHQSRNADSAYTFPQDSSPLFHFVSQHFWDPSGGIYTNLRSDMPSKEHTATGHQMLSESTALMLQYALLREDRALFENQIAFLRNRLLDQNRVRWRYEPDSHAAVTVNSTIDDLLIIRSLLSGSGKWGSKDYAGLADGLAGQLIKEARNGSFMADFYDWKSGTQASTVSSSYLDLHTLRLLSERNQEWKAVYEASKELLRTSALPNGLYAKTYLVEQKQWKRETKYNAIDVLYCALHMAEDRGDVSLTLNWLNKQWQREGRLFTDYDANGKPVSSVESPAVYAIAYRLLDQTGELQQTGEQIYKRMTELAVQDKQSPYYAGYVDLAAGEGFSFDQLQALLAEIERMKNIHAQY